MRQQILLLLLLAVVMCSAQQHPHPPHSLAIGIENGPAVVSFRELNTTYAGLNMDHQRNFSPSFSLRTNLAMKYFLPAKHKMHYDYELDQVAALDNSTTEYSYVQLSLQLMPCFYYRDKNFNLYLGLAAGIGSYTRIYASYDEVVNYPAQGETYIDESHRQPTNMHIGVSPTMGVGFNLGESRAGGEIEIALSYDKWQEPEGFSYITGFTAFGLQTSYRYNFER